MAQVFSAKTCCKMGICVCSRNPPGRHADLFNTKLKSWMRNIFKKGTEAKKLLSANLIVIKLQRHPSTEFEPLYFHLGYCNCQTWLFTLLKLVRDEREPSHPSYIPLRLADVREGVHRLLDSIFIGLQMLAELDLTQAWICEVCFIVQSTKPTTSISELLPHHVEISGDSSTLVCPKFLWRGWDEEQKGRPVRPPKPRKPRKPSGPKQTKKKSDSELPKESKRTPRPSSLKPDGEHSATGHGPRPKQVEVDVVCPLAGDDAEEARARVDAAFPRELAAAAAEEGDSFYEPSVANTEDVVFDIDEDQETLSSDAGPEDAHDSNLSGSASASDASGDWTHMVGEWLDQAEADCLFNAADGSSTNEPFNLSDHIEAMDADALAEQFKEKADNILLPDALAKNLDESFDHAAAEGQDGVAEPASSCDQGQSSANTLPMAQDQAAATAATVDHADQCPDDMPLASLASRKVKPKKKAKAKAKVSAPEPGHGSKQTKSNRKAANVSSDSDSSTSSSSISSMSGLSGISLDFHRDDAGNVVLGRKDKDAVQSDDENGPQDEAPPKSKDAAKTKEAASSSKPVAGGVRAKPTSDIRLDCCEYGDIRYNIKAQNLVAHCSYHSGNCRRTRTVKAPSSSATGARASQGRPLGLLAAWLEAAAKFETAAAHSSECRPTQQERKDARDRLMTTDEGPEFSRTYERTKGPDEPDEPENMT